MARIAGVNVPDKKRAVIALTYIYGVGRTQSEKILAELKIDESQRVKDMSEGELNSIRDYINQNYTVEGDLQRIVSGNLKRLRDIKSYRGGRHAANLPARGQRTKTNARTKRGRKVAVSGAQPKAATKT
jgi:small subunit ribosomal protein S13